MNDMSAVIEPKSDQWNADDFFAGPRTFTIREVRIKRGEEQPVDIYVDGSDKAYRPCKSMCRVLVHIWGPDAGKYNGRSLTLYRDPKVRFGKDAVGGIRISHMTDIPADKLDNGRVIMSLTATRAQRKPHVVMPLVVEKPANEDGAARWADAYIAKLEAIDTIEGLVAFENERAAKLAELGEKRPELHSRCVEAAHARGAALSREGKPDEDMGENFTDDGEGF